MFEYSDLIIQHNYYLSSDEVIPKIIVYKLVYLVEVRPTSLVKHKAS